MLTHPLLPKLKKLRLSAMADTLEARSELARQEGLTPAEFLALLLDDEIERRHNAKIARMEKAAGFDWPKSLSQFDFAAIPTLDRSVVLEMATCRFIERKENWLLVGPTGVGKTHASCQGHHHNRRKLQAEESASRCRWRHATFGSGACATEGV